MRILAVGTNRPCHRKLIEAGHDVLLAIEAGKVLPSDAASYSSVLVLTPEGPGLDPGAVGGLPAGIDVVAAYHDAYYERAHSLALALSAPCVVDVAASRRFRDKNETRRLLRGIDAGQVPFVVVDDRTTAEDAARETGFPCVVKPLSGEASMGVAFVDTFAELAAHTEQARRLDEHGRCLVEAMVHGPEFSVETFSLHGVHRVLAITEKFKFPGSPVEQGHLVPARLSGGDSALIADAVRGVLDGLGHQDGPGHTEIILSPEGPRLVESHNRMGGDRIAVLVEEATGIDYTGLVAWHGAGIPIDPDALVPSRSRNAAVWYSGAAPVGPRQRITAVWGLGEASRLPHIVRVEVLLGEGALASPLTGSFDRPALAIASGQDPAQVLQAARAAAGTLRFSYAGTSDHTTASTTPR